MQHALLLTPQDTLFFRDARPMSGSLAGHGASWPLPHILHQAFHAAFHRAGLDSHQHHTGDYRTRDYTGERDQRFGALKTAGPFPVDRDGNWYVPAPADAAGFRLIETPPSSLPRPLTHAFAAATPPSKEERPAWVPLDPSGGAEAMHSSDIFLSEARTGIGIDPDTQTQDGERFYTSHVLRLRDGWRLGLLAEADDKDHGDLVASFLARERRLILGGQQGVATVDAAATRPPFPACAATGGTRLRWRLLTPAVFHDGWRPHWVHPETGAVLLPAKVERRPGEARHDWRERVKTAPAIPARLIAALVPKPAAFSGWELKDGAPKPTQLAVPAGAVYVFEADKGAPPETLQTLAAALHLTPRSTLFGEKGFGLGLCSSFNP